MQNSTEQNDTFAFAPLVRRYQGIFPAAPEESTLCVGYITPLLYTEPDKLNYILNNFQKLLAIAIIFIGHY